MVCQKSAQLLARVQKQQVPELAFSRTGGNPELVKRLTDAATRSETDANNSRPEGSPLGLPSGVGAAATVRANERSLNLAVIHDK